MPEIQVIGPEAREPLTSAMARFMRRGEYPTLLAYWWDNHMSADRWRVLCDMAGGRTVRFHVPGLGVIGGHVNA